MRTTLFLTLLVFLVSCQSETDKQISLFEKKVDQFEKLTDDGVEKNQDALKNLGQEIGAIMDGLSTQTFSDEQQGKVTGISLRFQVSLAAIQENEMKKLNDNLNDIQKSIDSAALEIEKFGDL